MIEKLLKISNPLASSNHGNSPPKIDDSKNVKTTKISTLISSMSLKPAKKRTVIAFPLKPVKPKLEEKSKTEINKETKIPETKKQEIDVTKTLKEEKKSDNSDSLLDNNSDSKSENTISTENSPNLPIKSSVVSVSESQLPALTVSQVKRTFFQSATTKTLAKANRSNNQAVFPESLFCRLFWEFVKRGLDNFYLKFTFISSKINNTCSRSCKFRLRLGRLCLRKLG